MTGSRPPFAERLRGLRRAAGMTLEQLAEASGISARAISDMERGHSRAPQARSLAALADGLRLSGDDRVGLEEAARQARSPSAAGRPRPSELPRGVTDFVGRTAEIATVLATADRVGLDGPPPVLVVHGPPGLGKTAFAVRAADELRDAFPDGQLYVDLKGIDPSPIPVGEALHRLLRGLDMSPRGIADADDERSAQLRAVLAQRRCLLILDNAGSEAQVRPLLPASGSSLVVVTSRRALGGLEGVLRIGLPLLAPYESARLLTAIAAQAMDPDAAEQVDIVAKLCGHLPLALRIAGTRLASRPQWTVENLADRLTDTDRRLATLAVGDTGVVTAFALSHAQLSAAAATLFRRLALVAGGDFAAPLAAVLAESGLLEVEERLDELVELGLLQPEGTDRYRFHDLLRLYAGERLNIEEPPAARAAATLRMTTWLLETVIVAGRLYEPEYGALPDAWNGLVSLATLDEAGAWLRAEADNWLAALRAAAADGWHQIVVDVSEATVYYYDTCASWHGWYEVRGLSRAAAAALRDPRQEAVHLNLFAYAANYTARRFQEGADTAMEAYRLAESIGDLSVQARALSTAGMAWNNLLRHEDALRAHRTGQQLAERAGDHFAYVEQLVGGGYALELLGRYDEAIDTHRQALSELDRRPLAPRPALQIRAIALYGIVAAYDAAQRWAESLRAAELALPVVNEVGDNVIVSYTLILLGRAQAAQGHTAEARASLTRGIELLGNVAVPGSTPERLEIMARETLARLDDVHVR